MAVLPGVMPLIEFLPLRPAQPYGCPGAFFWLSAVLSGESATGRSVQ